MASTTTAWHDVVCGSAQASALADAIARGDSAAAGPARGSAGALLAGAVAQQLGRTVVLVVAHLDEADDALDDLEGLAEATREQTGIATGLMVERFPALEVTSTVGVKAGKGNSGSGGVDMELVAERLAVVRRAVDGGHAGSVPGVIVAPVQALMQGVPEADALDGLTLELREGADVPPGRLLDWLDRAGYSRQDAVEQPGDFATRGGIVDVFPVAGSGLTDADEPTRLAGAIRLDYFGDEVESIHRVDPDTMGSLGRLRSVNLVGGTERQLQTDNRTTNLLKLLPGVVPVLVETQELAEQARGYFERLTNSSGITPPRDLFRELTGGPHVELNTYSRTSNPQAERVELPIEALPSFAQDAKAAVRELGDLAGTPETRVTVLCAKPAERDRLVELLIEHVPDHYRKVDVRVGRLHRGLVWNDDGAAHHLVPHHELFHRYETRRRVRKIVSPTSTGNEKAGDAFLDLDVGDYVVHVDHGIAKFTGLKTMSRGAKKGEYLTLQFADAALLHVPAAQIDLVQKYVGGFQGRPPLSTLGGKRWKKQKESVADAVKDLAAELLRVQAARETQPGVRYPADTAWQKEFEAEFPYDETDDQLAAIAAVKADMTEATPMDRLICGDVGFGKTEVAVRAAFKCAEYGRQVAVLVPTTVLAEQHERTFRGRLADYPFRVESLSRFKSTKQQRETLQAVERGEVDVLIGTHRLLSDDVKFADLGMVVIDEEQRFGVEHKNKLLGLRLTAEVLTLTATPIPRTLHMSMVGLRDISSLTTPPVDRRAVVTEVVPYDERRIEQALRRE
ncbi:MAG: DEAD/DEAH box helicase, partial [Planctomycetota bacterium]